MREEHIQKLIIEKCGNEPYIKKEYFRKLKTLNNNDDWVILIGYLEKEDREYLYFLWHQDTHHWKRVVRVGNKVYGFNQYDDDDLKNMKECINEFSGDIDFLKDVKEIEWVKNIDVLYERGIKKSSIKKITDNIEREEER